MSRMHRVHCTYRIYRTLRIRRVNLISQLSGMATAGVTQLSTPSAYTTRHARCRPGPTSEKTPSVCVLAPFYVCLLHSSCEGRKDQECCTSFPLEHICTTEQHLRPAFCSGKFVYHKPSLSNITAHSTRKRRVTFLGGVRNDVVTPHIVT